MPTCEKCWASAYTVSVMTGEAQADVYGRFLMERNCSPEEQAGHDARWCGACGRRAIHEVTGECMSCNREPGDG